MMWHFSGPRVWHDGATPLLHLLWLCPHQSFKLVFFIVVSCVLSYQFKMDATLPTFRSLVAYLLRHRDGVLPGEELVLQYVTVTLAAHHFCLACPLITTAHRLLVFAKHVVVHANVSWNAFRSFWLITQQPLPRMLFLLDQSKGHDVFKRLRASSS